MNARTAPHVVEVARRAFSVGFLKGVVHAKNGRLAKAADVSESNTQFKEWWNTAAGFKEVE